MSHVPLTPSVDDQHLQRLKIHAVDRGTILMPVLTTLHRRRCEVTELSYSVAGQDGTTGHLELCLISPAAHRHAVPRWLERLVDVLAVEELR